MGGPGREAYKAYKGCPGRESKARKEGGTEKVKNYVILGLFIACGVLAFSLYCRGPEIKKEVRTVEKIVDNSTHTYRVVTRKITKPDGTIIDEHDTSTTESTTKTREKETVKTEYRQKDWIVGLYYQAYPLNEPTLTLSVSKSLFEGVYVGLSVRSNLTPLLEDFSLSGGVTLVF